MLLQFVLAILVLPLVQLVGLPVVESPQEIQSLIVGDLTTAARVALMLSTALLAPVVEELMFRGMLLQTALARWGRRPALLITSLAFAGLHLVTLDPSQFLAAAVITLPTLLHHGTGCGTPHPPQGPVGPGNIHPRRVQPHRGDRPFRHRRRLMPLRWRRARLGA